MMIVAAASSSSASSSIGIIVAALLLLLLLPQIVVTQSSAGVDDGVSVASSYVNDTKNNDGSLSPSRYPLPSPPLLPDTLPSSQLQLQQQQQQRRRRRKLVGGSGNTNENNAKKKPTTTIITKLESTLLHIGKAGGGAVLARTDSLGVPFRYKKVHPLPKPVEKLKQQNIKNYKTLMVTIRDPVDRFVSSFYWEALVACSRAEGDTRGTHGRGCNSWTDTKHCCMDYKQHQKRKLYKRLNYSKFWAKYNRSASNFAEAFCGYDYEGQREEAVEDLKMFKHAYHSIRDWLFTHSGGNNKKTSSKNNGGNEDDDDDMEWMDGKLIAIVQESGYNFTDQIDGAIEWVLSKTITEDAATENITAAFRRAVVAAEAQLSESHSHRTDDDNNYGDDHPLSSHSSKSLEHSSKSLEFPWVLPSEERSRISDMGSCCLARHYYRRDYELLSNADFVLGVCKGRAETACREAIRSIANRRRAAALLEDAGGPCGNGGGGGNTPVVIAGNGDNSNSNRSGSSSKNNTAPTPLQLPSAPLMYETQLFGQLIGVMLLLLLLYSRPAIGFAIKRHCVALLGFCSKINCSN